MSEPTKSTALTAPETPAPDRSARLEADLMARAQTPEEKQFAYLSASQYRRSAMIHRASSALAELGWGKSLSVAARAEVARFALMLGTDPVRHWEVLGGKLYDKAELWLELAASMPNYRGETHEYINDDERLTQEERAARRALRAKHNVPEDVKGACIVTLHLSNRPDQIGVNWAGNRKCFVAAKNAEGIKQDPIGEQDPGKTSFTRAFRRAAKLAFPLWFRDQAQRVGLNPSDEGLPISRLAEVPNAAIQQGKELAKELPERAAGALDVPLEGGRMLTIVGGKETPILAPEDPYADGPAPPVQTLAEMVKAQAALESLGAAAPLSDEEERERQIDLRLSRE